MGIFRNLWRISAKRTSAYLGLENEMSKGNAARKNAELITGCQYITESIRECTILGSFFDQLLGVSTGSTAVLGRQPDRMPYPAVKPVGVYHDASIIISLIENQPLTWMKVDRADRWGVYYTVIALFGDKCWLTVERNGAFCLRVFEKSF